MENEIKVQIKNLIYKKINGAELTIRIYYPKGCVIKRPALILYFGGGWKTGDIDSIQHQGCFMASKGFICVTPEYRTGFKHNTTVLECVEDAKDALYWVWQHSEELGIDGESIAVGGISAGGHLAVCTAVLQGSSFDVNGVYKIPKAMVLLNPVCDTSGFIYLQKQLGERILELSPLHNVKEGLPPTIIMHGTKDTIVPYGHAEDFCNKMLEAGNKCTLVPYEGRGHGFFNKGKTSDNEDFMDTSNRMCKFLAGTLLKNQN